MIPTSYIIVSPIRNEEAYIRLTIESVLAQAVKPRLWVIVNDGSTDDTAKIVQSYTDKYPWIKLINREDRGYRRPGAGVMKAFYAGLEVVHVGYDFIVKLDGDLSFESDYFERLFERFDRNPNLGIAGGGCYTHRGVDWVLRRVPRDHVRGATKIYRRECFEDIGGPPIADGWDSIDELRAQMKGWETCSFNELEVLHHRPIGTAESKLKSMMIRGEFSYYCGYHPLVMFLRGLYRSLVERPFILGGLAMLWGYVKSWLTGQPQIDDPELIAYSRKKQMRRLAFWRH